MSNAEQIAEFINERNEDVFINVTQESETVFSVEVQTGWRNTGYSKTWWTRREIQNLRDLLNKALEPTSK